MIAAWRSGRQACPGPIALIFYLAIFMTDIECLRRPQNGSVSEYAYYWSVKLMYNTKKVAPSKIFLDILADEVADKIDGLSNTGQIGELEGYYLYKTYSKNIAEIKKFLVDHENVEWYKMETYLKRTKRTTDAKAVYGTDADATLHFRDPLFIKQWHLKNNLGGLDCNVSGIWAHNITGRGVVVAVVDDGVEWSHPDLVDNYCKEGSFDLNSNDNDPSPVFDDSEENKHGTRCAGEIAAVPNSVCGVGVAFGSKFSGIRVLDGPTTDSTEATAFNKHMDINDVYSCSWGPEDDGKTVDGPHNLGRTALRHGVVAGRRGFGSIYVVASGNGGDNEDNCNYDGYANSIYTITVGAIDEFGHKPSYAEECASMLACSVSSGSGHSRSIVTTDWSLHHRDDIENACTSSHSGTSAATPLAAGMVALMLEVRPCLSWRDVQHIMAMTAVKVDGTAKWAQNAAGFQHSDTHGFGLLNAWRLVNAAKVWEPVPWLTSFTPDVSKDKDVVIPVGLDNPLVVRVEVSADDCDSHMLSTLEYVVFGITLNHHTRGLLKYKFSCPSGTESTIPPRPNDRSSEGLTEWSFSTVKCWGENPYGLYILKIYDTTKGETAGKVLGVLNEWRLTLYGSKWTASEMRHRKKAIGDAMSGLYLSQEINHTVKCPPGQVLDFDVTSALSGRTIKLLAMLSCFLLFWAFYYSFEMAFCNADDKEKALPVETPLDIITDSAVGGHHHYGLSSTGAQTFHNSAFHATGNQDESFLHEKLDQSDCKDCANDEIATTVDVVEPDLDNGVRL